MRLTAKFWLGISVVIALTLTLTTWLTIQRETQLFDRDLRRDVRVLGELLARSHQRALRLDGPTAAAAVLDDPALRHLGVTASWQPLRNLPAAAHAAVAAGELYFVRDVAAGRLDAYVPAGASAGPGAVWLTASLAPERRYVAATKWRWIATSLALLAGASVTVFGLGIVLVARPTRALVDKARRVGAGDLAGRVQLRQRDELGLLADELNTMTDRLAAARDRVADELAARLAAVEQLRHADRLTTVGRLASGIAHELGTPLNVIEGRAQMIAAGEVDGEEVVQSAQIVVQQSRRVAGIVRQLLDFARRGTAEKCPADLRPIAGSARNLLHAVARQSSVELRTELADEPCRAEIDDGQLLQVVTNLVVNAIAATAAGGEVQIAVRPTTARPPGGLPPVAAIELVVADTGCGIPPELRERVFEPFFTTKEIGQGTGLGLAVVHGIVADHRGWIELTSEPGRGTTFSVYLPACP